MKKNKPTVLVFLYLVILLSLCFAFPQSAQAQSGTPAEVLAEINAYRAANGLGPLAENVYLDIAAQNHVNWMVANGIYDHIGEGGSTYTDRALAAGYGEGQNVNVTENWGKGHQMTAYQVVNELWKTPLSGIHNIQMLTTSYNEFGAGVALDGDGMTVYVVKFGIVTGGKIPDVPAQPTDVPIGPTSTPVPIAQSITTATPNPDGSIWHVVQYGQPPAAIAEAYEIPLAELLAQNNLTEDSVIYPEQELLIQPARLETPTPTESPATPEETPEETNQAPSATPTRARQLTPTATTSTPTELTQKNSGFLIDVFSGDTLWIGVGLVSISVLGLGLLFYTSSRLH
jgi:LysM repeat protein